jgi:preprotein translocase subunit SecD
LTALIAAIVLYRFGTGPIRGFAVTQIVGVVATIVTGLWLLKSMLTYLTDVIGVTKIKI